MKIRYSLILSIIILSVLIKGQASDSRIRLARPLIKIPLEYFSSQSEKKEILIRRVLIKRGAGTKWWGVRESQTNIMYLYKQNQELAKAYFDEVKKYRFPIVKVNHDHALVDISSFLHRFEMKEMIRDASGSVFDENQGLIGSKVMAMNPSYSSIQNYKKHEDGRLEFVQRLLFSTPHADEYSHAASISEVHYQLKLLNSPNDFKKTNLTSPNEHYGIFTVENTSIARKWNLKKSPVIFHIDDEMPEYAVNGVQFAVDYWNRVFKQTVIKIADEKRSCRHHFSVNQVCWIKDEIPGATFSVQQDPRSGEILPGIEFLLPAKWFEVNLSEEQKRARVAMIAAHEIGHTFGLKHNFFTPWEGFKGKRVANSVMAYLGWEASEKLASELEKSDIVLAADQAMIDFLYYGKTFGPVMKAGFLSDHDFKM